MGNLRTKTKVNLGIFAVLSLFSFFLFLFSKGNELCMIYRFTRELEELGGLNKIHCDESSICILLLCPFSVCFSF